jgi:hypothetical protein
LSILCDSVARLSVLWPVSILALQLAPHLFFQLRMRGIDVGIGPIQDDSGHTRGV